VIETANLLPLGRGKRKKHQSEAVSKSNRGSKGGNRKSTGRFAQAETQGTQHPKSFVHKKNKQKPNLNEKKCWEDKHHGKSTKEEGTKGNKTLSTQEESKGG